MAKRVGVDKWLFGVTLVLVVIGLVMVFSASAVRKGRSVVNIRTLDEACSHARLPLPRLVPKSRDNQG